MNKKYIIFCMEYYNGDQVIYRCSCNVGTNSLKAERKRVLSEYPLATRVLFHYHEMA
ncbi:hypothetical protein [Bacteroides sp. 51]|uniref:hypothetical protein n=1 Tax=Bacteroides sp. 51 TaxID=2302938 RepID=UPI0013D27963|nr:hypothetical protein [Bacteroides sp. 51]